MSKRRLYTSGFLEGVEVAAEPKDEVGDCGADTIQLETGTATCTWIIVEVAN